MCKVQVSLASNMGDTAGTSEATVAALLIRGGLVLHPYKYLRCDAPHNLHCKSSCTLSSKGCKAFNILKHYVALTHFLLIMLTQRQNTKRSQPERERAKATRSRQQCFLSHHAGIPAQAVSCSAACLQASIPCLSHTL